MMHIYLVYDGEYLSAATLHKDEAAALEDHLIFTTDSPARDVQVFDVTIDDHLGVSIVDILDGLARRP